MDGFKKTMYNQAGRRNSWNTGYPDDIMQPEPAPEQPRISIPMPIAQTPPVPQQTAQAMPMPMPMPMPMLPMADSCQSIAMAFVTNQKWQEIYEPEQGFSRGTIFQELDLPFVGEGACKHE